jgi:hypothetical protein
MPRDGATVFGNPPFATEKVMRTIIAFIILAVSIAEGWTVSLGSESRDFTPRVAAAACDTKGAAQCQQQLQGCMKNCNSNNNPTSCRQDCFGQFKGCKAGAGCGGT